MKHSPIPSIPAASKVPCAAIPVPGEARAPVNPIGATAATAACNPTGEAGAPNLSTYQLRTTDCYECEGSGEVSFEWSDGFPDIRRCDDCGGSGETDAACCVCHNVAPLDEDGFCENCLQPSGWALAWDAAEKLAVGMVRR